MAGEMVGAAVTTGKMGRRALCSRGLPAMMRAARMQRGAGPREEVVLYP